MTRLRFAVILLALGLSSQSARGEDTQIWMASGLPGGTYEVYALNLAELLRGYQTWHRDSTGSARNLDLLADGQADVAFAQADVYASRLGADGARYGVLLVVGKLADECVYLAHRRKGPVTHLAALGEPVAGRPARLAAGAKGGGMSDTWRHLVALDPSLAAAEVIYEGDTLAVNQLAVGSFDAVGWVTDPKNLRHKMLQAVMKNDELHVMSLTDPSLLKALPDGTQIYEAREVRLAKGEKPPKIETICTSSLLLARKDADPALISKLADVLSLNRDRILGHR